jgi:hypothetical protein
MTYLYRSPLVAPETASKILPKRLKAQHIDRKQFTAHVHLFCLSHPLYNNI